MKLLFVGDVVGDVGCRYLRQKLPSLRRELGVDVTIVNGENSANGNGITAYSAEQLFGSGADLLTTGNHAFQRKDNLHIFDSDNILRPANYSDACPGKGVGILDFGAYRIAVINLSGVLFMENLENPFTVIDALLEEIDTPNIFVDFHAEATSEKKAMGHYLAGRVTAMSGTHTHVQTADACILQNRTGYITDAGMTGVEDSVLGVKKEIAMDRLRLHVPIRFEEAQGDCFLNGVLVEFNEKTGICNKIESIFVR